MSLDVAVTGPEISRVLVLRNDTNNKPDDEHHKGLYIQNVFAMIE